MAVETSKLERGVLGKVNHVSKSYCKTTMMQNVFDHIFLIKRVE